MYIILFSLFCQQLTGGYFPNSTRIKIQSIQTSEYHSLLQLHYTCRANTARLKLKSQQKVTSAASRLCATYPVYSANCFSFATRVQLLSLAERSSCTRILQQIRKVQNLITAARIIRSLSTTVKQNRHEILRST